MNQLFPILIVVALFALMYFFMIRPQSKRRKEMQQMQQTLGVGSDVVTIGGLYGTVVETDDESVTLEIDEGVTARYTRQAVARILPPVAAEAESETEEEEEVEEAEATERSADEDKTEKVDAVSGAKDGTEPPKLSKKDS